MVETEPPTFLPGLTAAFKSLDGMKSIPTKEFTTAYEAIFPIFDHLGTVFSFAKGEMLQKLNTIKKAGEEGLETLDVVIDRDIKAGKATVKDSCARNIHRLLAGIGFIASLLKNMAADQGMPLRIAAGSAYDAHFITIHTWMVRTAVKASLYLLPTRENFLKSIGENEATAKEHSADFIPTVAKLVKHIESYYQGIKMPASTATTLQTTPMPAT